MGHTEIPTQLVSLSSQVPGASALAGKPHSYCSWTVLSSRLKIIFILLCTVNRIIVLEWSHCDGQLISSCRPDLSEFPTFRSGDLMEFTVHSLENPLQYGNDMQRISNRVMWSQAAQNWPLWGFHYEVKKIGLCCQEFSSCLLALWVNLATFCFALQVKQYLQFLVTFMQCQI